LAQATTQGSGEQIAASELGALVDGSAYIGEVFSLGYSEALVQIHDFHRRQARDWHFHSLDRNAVGVTPMTRRKD
jgi:hypothetical protein